MADPIESPPADGGSGLDPKLAAQTLVRNKKAFVTYNIARIRELIRYLSPKKLQLFQALPFLLHVNSPRFPGYVATPGTPHGIYRFHASGFWKSGLKQFSITDREMRSHVSDKNHILGLYLMGSSGTLAQTEKSDFDYWVLVNEALFDAGAYARLSEKLKKIEEWCKEAFGQQVTFFILRPSLLRENDFSGVDAESSGSAQKTLLKEEFYRTFISICGKIPFWAITPSNIPDEQYAGWIESAAQAYHIYYQKEDYIDLGNLFRVDPGECLGALLWQMYKARSDPAKALIKAALIAHYHFFQDDEGLLCDAIKTRFPKRSIDGQLIDPYAIVYDTAERFFRFIGDQDGLRLIRTGVCFRLGGFPDVRRPEPDGPKGKLLERLLVDWEWDEETLDRIFSFTRWTEAEKCALDRELFEKLPFLYQMVGQAGEGEKAALQMKAVDLEALKARISASFKDKPGKLPRCSAWLKAVRIHYLAVDCEGGPEGPRTWSAFDFSRSSLKGDDTFLYENPRLAGVVGWLLANGLVEDANAEPVFQTNRCGGAARAMDFFRTAKDFFQSRSPEESTEPEPLWDRVLVAPDLEKRGAGPPSSVDIIAVNSWGELYFEHLSLSDVENRDTRWYIIAQGLCRYDNTLPNADPVLTFWHADDAEAGRLRKTVSAEMNRIRAEAIRQSIDREKGACDREDDDDDDADRPYLDRI